VRCLIVDDNDHFLEASQRLLEREGVRVVGTARSAQECLERARALAPDIVLLDVDLGEENGFDVCRRLYASGVAAHVVFTSTHHDPEYAELSAETPAAGYLPKSLLSRRALEALLCA
jgi:DNA-binding NarL/FixJ family response regulator